MVTGRNQQKLNFGAEIAKILPLIMREFTRSQKDILSQGLLSIPQIVILDFLSQRGPCKMNELAELLNFSMSAVTAIVDKMIGFKLVKRERSQKDRRVVNVTILAKGREAVRRVNEARRDCANDLFAVLTEQDKREYIRILSKVYDSLRQAR